MTAQPRPREVPRVPLSRERVLRAAIDLADAAGIESLTMRRLAQELGVEAMTLYYHVANKDDMLAGMVDLVMDEMELPLPNAAWKAGLRKIAMSSNEVLERHRWAARLILSGPGVSGARMRHMDAILGTLRNAGFSPELTDHAYHALDSHIMGFALWVAGMNLGSDENLAAMASDFLQELEREELPHLAEHVQQHLKPRDVKDEGEFAFGLDLILDGLERIRTSTSTGPS